MIGAETCIGLKSEPKQCTCENFESICGDISPYSRTMKRGSLLVTVGSL
jgi:hypothetical protein